MQSDFWSTRSAAASLNAGLDHEMPDAKWLNQTNITNALNDTSLEMKTIDRALTRRFTQMFRFGQFERPYDPGEIDAAANGATARRLGAQMAVLLKNDAGLLPITNPTGQLVIIGQSKFAEYATQGGGGSSKVDPLYTVAPLEGLRDILTEMGADATADSFIVADDLSNLELAIEAARTADTVILMAGLVATEGADMPSPNMLNQQNEMLDALLGVNKNTVVVMKDSAPVLMPWVDKAPTILEVWNQGAEDGHVVPDLLFGRVNPSGKVPTTYPRSAGDTLYANHPERYPGTDEGAGYPVIRYTEGLEMGYRWFQAQGIEPLFCFGHGLSYTTFDLADISVDAEGSDGSQPVTVRARLTNTGERAGASGAGLPGCWWRASRPSACGLLPRSTWNRGSRGRRDRDRPRGHQPPVQCSGTTARAASQCCRATTPFTSAPPARTPCSARWSASAESVWMTYHGWACGGWRRGSNRRPFRVLP